MSKRIAIDVHDATDGSPGRVSGLARAGLRGWNDWGLDTRSIPQRPLRRLPTLVQRRDHAA